MGGVARRALVACLAPQFIGPGPSAISGEVCAQRLLDPASPAPALGIVPAARAPGKRFSFTLHQIPSRFCAKRWQCIRRVQIVRFALQEAYFHSCAICSNLSPGDDFYGRRTLGVEALACETVFRHSDELNSRRTRLNRRRQFASRRHSRGLTLVVISGEWSTPGTRLVRQLCETPRLGDVLPLSPSLVGHRERSDPLP